MPAITVGALLKSNMNKKHYSFREQMVVLTVAVNEQLFHSVQSLLNELLARAEIQRCSSSSCDGNATCIEQRDGSLNCVCNDGYTGNGQECSGKHRVFQ
jgi:hypothetical protein